MKRLLTLILALILMLCAAGIAEESQYHEIYLIEDRNSLSGVYSIADLQSREAINKALPVEQKSDLVIGLTPCTLDNAYYVARDAAAQVKCDEYGYELKIIDANFDIAQQTKAVETFVTLGVDVIIIDAVDAAAAAQSAAYAVENGIPVIAVGNSFGSDSAAITTVLANQYENGYENGLYAAAQFVGQDIKATVVLGQMGYSVADSRISGNLAGIISARKAELGQEISKEDAMLEAFYMMNELRDTGKASYEEIGFYILGYGEGNWTEEGGQTATETLLTANSDMNLILAENDFMGIGAIRAIETMGMTPGEGGILIACSADGSKEAFEYIMEGKLLSTGYNCPQMAGQYAVELIHMIFEEGYDANNLPIETTYPAHSINATNVEEFYDPDSDFAKPMSLEFRTIDQILAEMG